MSFYFCGFFTLFLNLYPLYSITEYVVDFLNKFSDHIYQNGERENRDKKTETK